MPLLLVTVAVLLRLGALLAPRHLSLDDGAYGASVVDMRHGLLPYRDLFSSQGPLHFPLLYIGDLLGLRTRNAPRVAPVLAGVAASHAVWATARRLGSPSRAAVVAGLLIATSGSMLWSTGPVTGDGPAIALAAWAVWAAVACRDTPTITRALVAGGFLGAALATKPLVGAVALPVAWWCGADSRRRVAIVVGSAAAVWFAATLPWGIAHVWDQSVMFHLDKHVVSSPLGRLRTVAKTLADRDVILLGALTLGLGTTVARRREFVGVCRRDVIVVAAWCGLTGFVLASEKSLLIGHVATLVLPLALLCALSPPPLRWLAVSLVVLLPVQAYELADIIWPSGYPFPAAQVVAALRALPPGALAVSDIPGLVWQAGRVTPPMLNDNSDARISANRLTMRMVAAGAADRKTCAVVIWSYRFGEHLPGLRAALGREGYDLTRNYAPNEQLWVKSKCDPSSGTRVMHTRALVGRESCRATPRVRDVACSRSS